MSTESIKIDRERAKEVIRVSLEARSERRGLFTQDIEPPEKPFIELVKEHSVATGNPHLPLNAIFLITPFVFGDDTYRFFSPDFYSNRSSTTRIPGTSTLLKPAGIRK